ncbi:hypothetical protein R5W24_005946 [Gemmata sp. JC717]|uniref:hypothetical protein n=1 Tax=Gemmata algarum TaxID=2975278 RepID=UPI0021BB64EC|nr:hypothetical protein [Gemmata algarum]MDY3556773.1 hypothetical protein [Gemmata algarum]
MAKKQAAPVPVADLVRLALLNVANATGDVKLGGKGGLFPTASGTNKEAADACITGAVPLLTVLRTEGKAQIVGLTPAGFERIAGELAEEKVGPLAKAIAAAAPAAARIEFIQSVIGRTPFAAPELTPLLEEAVAAEKAEQDARIEAAKKRREAEEIALAALERAKALLEERRRNRLDALRREYELEGAKASELPEPAPRVEPRPEPKAAAPAPASAPEPKTDEERDFRRYTADRLAAAWRDAWTDGKTEGRDYLETAMWNIRGMQMIGEPGQQVAFNGRVHESEQPAAPGDPLTVLRPGWLLKTDDEDYVALKAVVGDL